MIEKAPAAPTQAQERRKPWEDPGFAVRVDSADYWWLEDRPTHWTKERWTKPEYAAFVLRDVYERSSEESFWPWYERITTLDADLFLDGDPDDRTRYVEASARAFHLTLTSSFDDPRRRDPTTWDRKMSAFLRNLRQRHDNAKAQARWWRRNRGARLVGARGGEEHRQPGSVAVPVPPSEAETAPARQPSKSRSPRAEVFERVQKTSSWATLCHRDKEVLAVLLLYHWPTMYPSIATLSKEISAHRKKLREERTRGASATTVKRAIRNLVEKGILTREQRRTVDGYPTSSIYALNDAIFAKSESRDAFT